MRYGERLGMSLGISRACVRGIAHLLTVLAVTMMLPATGQGVERSGREVVDSVCSECHATGENGAPRIGDTEAWKPRATQGLSSLTRHALNGIREMPAHGGDPGLSDLEIARAIAYMVNQSGGHWIEPAGAEDLASERTGEQVVNAQCTKCHAEGIDGAPRIGDLTAWIPRIKQGIPYLVASAIHGHGGMPPRGGQANLTDSELRSAILYMYNPTTASSGESSAIAKPEANTGGDPNHQSIAGVEVYLGITPAESVRRFPADSPEKSMHGGVPPGSGYYHVNVSLQSETDRSAISGARVRMEMNSPGLSGRPIKLEPMLLAGSYGNYVKPKQGAHYFITLRINQPGSAETIEAKFEHRFQ